MSSICPTQAQQTTTTTAGVSPWAQNYVNTMLGAAGQQVFNMQKDPTTGAMTATGLKPYVPFGAPMSAQGDVVPYGGQQGGMGWGAYGGGPGYGYGPQQQYQTPQGGYGQQQYQTPQGGYGQQQPQPQYGGAYNPNAPMADLTGKSLPQTPFGQQPPLGQPDSLGRASQQSAQQIAQRMNMPLSKPQAQGAPGADFSQYGLDKDVVDYINKQNAQGGYGQVYTSYDPETKTFTQPGGIAGTMKKSLEDLQSEMRNPIHMMPAEGFEPWQMSPASGVPDASQMPEEGFESWQQAPQKAPAMSAPAPTQQAPQPMQQPAQGYGPYAGYAPGTMQAGMGPGEQIAAEASVAGPSGLQQRAYETAYNMQTPGQYGQATDIARTAGLGLLNTAGQAQGLQNLGLGALEQGRQYARDITDPYRTQQFMSPYMQNVVNAQQREAKRQSDIMALSQRAQAAKSGAFGGSGRAIMEAERRRNLATQLGDIQAQGLQSAYQNAQQQQLLAQQQAMQGYTTGIQGYGQGITGQTGAFGQATGAGGTLGNLGGQQLGSQQSIANLQNLYGQQLQQNRQNVLNQAMQNYNMQRLYPQQQLQYLSGLLSGLPVSSTGQVANIPGPNMLSQLAGLGTTAVGAYGLYNKMFPGGKKGGNVRSNPGGGIASIGLRKALNQ